ncbi:MAG: LD-carboxypeptidase [Pelomonas sp.]|nr:LD-carboxypeptidase [Roseateles sp.]
MSLLRRNFAKTLAAGVAGAAALAAPAARAAAPTGTAARPPVLLPRRLQPGDTIALVSPANATFDREQFDIAHESLTALGFKVREGRFAHARRGAFGGTDADRAADVNAQFADDGVAGIMAMTGGSGCNRILDKLDYALIRRKPKYFGGFSDLTSLVNGIHQQTGLVTFHAPMATSEWNAYSVEAFQSLVMRGETPRLANPAPELGDELAQRQDRTRTIRGGKARGVIAGGNLAVLTSLAGTPYFPDLRGAILFIEEVNEYIYRVDRMLSTLRLMGVLDQVAGVVLGHFTNCEPGTDGYGALTLDEVFDDYFLPLGVPVYRGAMIGHIRRKLTLPLGGQAELDADACTLQILAPAVA